MGGSSRVHIRLCLQGIFFPLAALFCVVCVSLFFKASGVEGTGDFASKNHRGSSLSTPRPLGRSFARSRPARSASPARPSRKTALRKRRFHQFDVRFTCFHFRPHRSMSMHGEMCVKRYVRQWSLEFAAASLSTCRVPQSVAPAKVARVCGPPVRSAGLDFLPQISRHDIIPDLAIMISLHV